MEKSLNRFCKIIVLTEYEKNWLLSIGVSEEKIEVIPNGLPDEFLDDISNISFEKVSLLRRKLNVEDKFVILFLSRPSSEKNFRVVMGSLKLLPKRDKNNVVYIITGSDCREKRKLMSYVKYNKNH